MHYNHATLTNFGQSNWHKLCITKSFSAITLAAIAT